MFTHHGEGELAKLLHSEKSFFNKIKYVSLAVFLKNIWWNAWSPRRLCRQTLAGRSTASSWPWGKGQAPCPWARPERRRKNISFFVWELGVCALLLLLVPGWPCTCFHGGGGWRRRRRRPSRRRRWKKRENHLAKKTACVWGNRWQRKTQKVLFVVEIESDVFFREWGLDGSNIIVPFARFQCRPSSAQAVMRAINGFKSAFMAKHRMGNSHRNYGHRRLKSASRILTVFLIFCELFTDVLQARKRKIPRKTIDTKHKITRWQARHPGRAPVHRKKWLEMDDETIF